MLKKLLFLSYLLLAMVSTTFAQSLASHNGVTFDPILDDIYKTGNYSDSELRVIFTFENAELAAAARPQLLEMGGKFVGPEFEIIPMQGVNATMNEVMAMTKIPGVIGVWQDRKMAGELHQAVIVSSVKDVWEDSEFMDLNDGLSVTGRGVGVLVNDSGFDGQDTDIQSHTDDVNNLVDNIPPRIVQNVRGNGSAGNLSWVESAEPDTDQGGGHGSHCMGIVGADGRHSNGKITGVAPGAYLVGYGSGAALFILDTGGGFEYVAKHGRDYNIRVMSNSFGTTSDTTFMSFEPAAPLNVATKALVDEGVVVVFSSGNSGPTDGKITGNYKTAPWVVTVGNGEKSGVLAGSSSPGRKDPNREHASMRESINVGGTDYLWENRPTVVAPGTDIVSVRATGSAIAPLAALDDVGLSPAEIPYYTILTGTSMACPHVAGIVALMLEANPDMDFRAVKATLQRTAIPMAEEFYRRGAGYVNAHAAVAAAFHGLCDGGTTYEEKYGLAADGAFGFDDDPWKTCPLHPEVADRLKTVIPTINGIEGPCAPDAPVLVDATGSAETEPATSSPFFDIKEVRMHDETETNFQVTLEVEGNLVASPPSTPGVDADYYDVHFKLTKAVGDDPNEEVEPDVTYILSSYNDAISGPTMILTVKSADGTTRPATNAQFYMEIDGGWDTGENTMTWIVEKADLNVDGPPLTTGATGTRDGRAAKAGDKLSKWESYVYHRTGTVTPDGPGVYTDTGAGECFRNLEVSTTTP